MLTEREKEQAAIIAKYARDPTFYGKTAVGIHGFHVVTFKTEDDAQFTLTIDRSDHFRTLRLEYSMACRLSKKYPEFKGIKIGKEDAKEIAGALGGRLNSLLRGYAKDNGLWLI